MTKINGLLLRLGVLFLIAGFLGAIVFVSPLEALLTAALAMVAEFIDFDLNKQRVDDNVIVPLVAGTVIYVMRLYL